jgi:hypothetical protein
MTFAERVEQLVAQRAGGSRVKFAALIGRPRLTVFKLLRPGYQPPLAVVQDVLRAFPDVDARWLLLGASDGGPLHGSAGAVERSGPKVLKPRAARVSEV